MLRVHVSLLLSPLVPCHSLPGVVPAASLAQALEMPAQHCQLLLDTQAAVAPIPPAASAPPCSGAPLHGILLFLFAQLYGREQNKPDTKDHWPDEKAVPNGPVDSLSSPTRSNRASVAPGACWACNVV